MKKLSLILIALIAFAQTAWAQTDVSTEQELRNAIEDGANITLTQDITVASHLTIGANTTVTINLGGHTLRGNGTALDGSDGSFSCIFIVASTGNLTLSNGTLADADNSATSNSTHNGGAIVNKGTATLTNVNINNCKGKNGGAIRNNDGAMLTFNSGTISGCTGDDGGAVYNVEGAMFIFNGGTIENCTSENHSGGGINNHGTLTISGGTISGNSVTTYYGGGVYIGSGTFNMSGNPTITNNTVSSSANNVYLYGTNLITCSGAFTEGANIGISLENYNRSFTSGYKTQNGSTAPGTYFHADNSGATLSLDGNEVSLDTQYTSVSNESQLRSAISDGANIKLTADIALGNCLEISGNKTVTINLAGHMLNRGCTSRGSQVIGVRSGSTLYLYNGTVTGGWGGGGGGMFNEGTMYLTSVIITGNTDDDRGGGISNDGTLTMTDCTVSNNTSRDAVDPAGGGGIFNYNGKTATLTNCTITGNTANTFGGGGICNYGTMTLNNCSLSSNNANTTGGGIWNGNREGYTGTLNINGCDITGNVAGGYGDGIYIDNSTLNMQGLCTVTGNNDGNIYLYGSGTVITVTGAFTDDSSIGVGFSDYGRKFTSGYSTYNSGTDPGNFFSSDNYKYVIGEKDGEAYPYVPYIERSWTGGNTDGHVVSTQKLCTSPTAFPISSTTDETTLNGDWYVLSGTFTFNGRVIINNSPMNFILLDGCNVEFDKGIYIPKNHTLNIYAQSDGDSKGYMWTDGSDGENGSIGGNEDNCGGHLVIHGGRIYAKPGSNNSAGIGGGDGSSSGMQSVTIYGGDITAEGKNSGPGIGGGQENNTPPTVTIYGGIVTATGGEYSAGIGGGYEGNGGSVYVNGGTVTANGGEYYAAGIGGGIHGQGGTVTISGGTVTATGGYRAAGIGGGWDADGGNVTISGGTVTVTAGSTTAHAIGRGAIYDNTSCSDGSLTLGNTISVKPEGGSCVNSGDRVSTLHATGTYIIQECDHSGEISYTDTGNDYYHHIDCQYCEGCDEHHVKGEGDTCSMCGHRLPEHAYTFYEAKADGSGYQSEGTAYYVTATHEFTFPSCSVVPNKKVFAGWLLSNTVPSGILAQDSEDLIQADSIITVAMEGDSTYYARFRETYFSGGEGTVSNPFLISDAADWNRLANAVKNGITFSGMYFEMTDDISVTTMVGTTVDDRNFSGTFDGDGHTLTFNSNVSYRTAPFRCVSGVTIKNLHVDGTIETNDMYAGGFIARAKGTTTIENCRSSVTINSTYDNNGWHGGFVSEVNSGTTTIKGCVFDGKLISTCTSKWGGFIGVVRSDAVCQITDCLFAPTELNVTGSSPFTYTFYTTSNGTTTLTNCYYTEAFGTAQGTKAYTVESGTPGLTLNYSGSATNYGSIKAYSFGLLYDGTLYSGNGKNVTFTPDAPAGYAATNVQAAHGTLNDHGDYTFTLTMPNTNDTITADFIATVTRFVEAASIWESSDPNNPINGWTFISSPVASDIAPTEVSGLVGTYNSTTGLYNYDLYRLNPSTTRWENYNNTAHHNDFNLVNGTGYLYASRNGTKLVFVGNFNDGNSKTVDLIPGWNLVGNPFTDSVAVNRNYYKMNSAGSAIEPVDITQNHDSIAICTGIVVQATGDNETITFSRKTPSKSSAAPNNGGLNITLTQANTRGASTGSVTLLDKAILSFNEGSQLGKFYFGTQNANIYIPQDGEEYAIVSVPAGTDVARNGSTNEMPLNFKAKENGTYTLTVNPEGVELAYLHLIDNMTGADVDLLTPPACGHPLSEGEAQSDEELGRETAAGRIPPLRGGQGVSKPASYTFTATTTDYASRFKLVFSTATGNADGDDAPFAFISNGNIIITGEGTLQMMDMTGRVIICRDAARHVSTTGMPAGMYVLRLIDGNDVKTQKLVIE